MKIGAIYNFFVQEGIKTDPRKKSEIDKRLAETKKSFRKLNVVSKKLFDKENFTNPYSDTRVLFGERNLDVRHVLVGIDIEAGEMALAHQLKKIGRPIDLVLAHHPEGIALAGLHEVMALQTDLLSSLGLKPEIAKDLMNKRMEEVARRLHAGNHTRTVDAARLLGIPLMCCHTPSDNHVSTYLQNKMDKQKPKTLQNVIDLLLKEPEYQDALKNKCGPTILIGKPKDKAGKILVDMTGGTEGSKDIFARLSQTGIDTLLAMHLSEDHYNKIKGEHINVIIASHIASDNLGLNLLFDKLEDKDSFEFIECSGFRRVNRLK